ncbi:hypothetical protein Poli38472_009443 [Pythium oligandrum]|uniref:t-SNARE coiled-coil homology domain-containing protein n=1 Tax=Pythium oligandrum TaxID=41045 RepID=A0A8K1FFR4_PYTOL|nr:hypothetical protein Poli38472_009443 [Pythium oligandrum]|eukprot:TMW61950.1 hypothetical protein Poli38472_009443 [Pythium oligandrum]
MTGFDGYLADFESAREEAQQAIDKYEHCGDARGQEELLVEARSSVDEVERYIRILENEANEGKKSASDKRKLGDKVRHCKTQHQSLRSHLEKAILVADSRAKTAESAVATDVDGKQGAVRYAERLDRNGRHLDEAQRTLAETEAIAANVANNLLQQRNQLERAHMDVDQTQQDTEQAGSHLRRLTRKALTNKICLIFVMLCLAVAIALVSYYKWYPRNKKDYLGILPNATTVAPAPVPAPAPASASG